MKIPRRITVRMLEQMGACDGGITNFRSWFGRSASFIPANVYEYDRRGLSGMGMLLAYIDPSSHKKAMSNWIAQPAKTRSWPGHFYAAALCRLARQNLPAKGAKA